MHYYHKFALIGIIISFFPIIFGIVALTTSSWIVINHGQPSHRIDYSLFQQCKANDTDGCTNIDSFQTPQYFEIIGYIILILGLLAGVLCTALIDKRHIHFIAPVILVIGTLSILLGFIFYIKSVMENIPSLLNTKVQLGYSMILMIATCMNGCILIAYFSFSAGYIHRHILGSVHIY
jgi:heme A synthase